MSNNKEMRLYEVPRGSRVVFGNLELDFHHVDGAFSLCVTPDGSIVHLSSNARVTVISGGMYE